jgi:hypothetical protein
VAVEAYPLDAKLTPSASFTGYRTTYERLNFKRVAAHDSTRPIMRREF